jgi:CHAT domain-containing protein
VFAAACRTAADPQTTYDRIDAKISRGELADAKTDVDLALNRFGAGNVEWLWRFRILKARILASQSDSSNALAVLSGDLPAPLANTDIAVQKLLLEGAAYRIAQDFDKSDRAFVAAEQRATSSFQQLLPRVLIARAALEVDQKNYTVADETYRRALFLARQQNDRDQEAAALVNLARLAMSQERFDAAIDQNQAALRLSRSMGKQTYVATALGNMGWSYFELGDFESALDFYKQGAQASAESGLSGYSAYWFTGVANSYLALREYGLAEELARNTLERASALKNAQTTTECLNTLAEVMLRTHRLSEAKRYNQEALKIEDSGSDTFGVPDSLILAGDIAAAEKRFGDADHFFHRVLSGPSLDAPLRWQAEAGLAEVRDGEGKPKEAERLYLQAIDTIEKARHSIGHDELRLSFLSSGIAVYGEYVDFLVRQGRSADALRQAELSRAQTLGEGLSSAVKATSRTIPSVQPQQLAQRLHGTLLFYWLGEEHSYLWVITPGKIVHFTLPPSSEIDPLVKAYRGAIVNSRDVLATEERQTGEKLYAMLIASAHKLIPANSRVILLPDGSLYGLNFETLIAPEPKPHYWIEDVTLATANSLTLLASSSNRSVAKGKSLLLVGNTKQANPAFPPLSQAPEEMKRVGQYFLEPQRAILEGARATPSAYLGSNPERFSYVHFVTHGTASRARPLESAVILSPEGDSYKLYARDIVTRHLRAELVTISACYGSGSRAYSGEGLVGLSWAFLRAGAHNVIGALWEVADAPATPQLMDGLYKELNQGRDPATALRNAKLALLRSGNVFAKPFYWAPFQLYAGS